MDNGDVLAVTKDSARIAGKVQAGTVYVDGIGIGDIGNIVIRDRKILSEDGLLSAIVTINKETKEVLGSPVIISRGFVYMRDHEVLTTEISETVNKVVTKKLKQLKTINVNILKREITKSLKDLVQERTERNPMIMPVIMTTN